MAVARAAHDFLSSVGAAGHHEKRGGNKRPERQLRGSFFRDGNCVCGILGGKRQRTQFLLSSSERNSLSRCGEANSPSKNTRVAAACKKNLHGREFIFYAAVRREGADFSFSSRTRSIFIRPRVCRVLDSPVRNIHRPFGSFLCIQTVFFVSSARF